MMEKQMKDLAWNTFKQTGDINTFMEFMQIKDMQNNVTQNNIQVKSQDGLQN